VTDYDHTGTVLAKLGDKGKTQNLIDTEKAAAAAAADPSAVDDGAFLELLAAVVKVKVGTDS
jgi:hypothetical protein